MLKKTVSFLGWALVAFTILSLILTVLTTYQIIPIQFTPIKYINFNNYKILDMLIICTMIVWAINFYDNSEKSRNLLFSAGCAFIALGTLFFMYMGIV